MEVDGFQKKNEPSIFPIQNEQASSIKDILLWLFANLRTVKRISIGKRALQRRKKGTNDFHNIIFAEVFAKITSKKATTRFRSRTELSSLLQFFPPKNILVRSFREPSNLAASVQLRK